MSNKIAQLKEKIRKLEIPPSVLTAKHAVLSVFKLCGKLANTVPKEEDTIYQSVVKVGAMTETVISYIAEESHIKQPYYHLSRGLGLTKFSSNFIVKILYSLYKAGIYEAKEEKMEGDSSYLIFPIKDKLVYLYKQNQKDEVDSFHYEIHMTPGLQPEDILSTLWEKFNNKIMVSTKAIASSEIELTELITDTSMISLYGRDFELLDPDIVNCVLIVGPPGVGKTSAMYKFAEEHNKKIIKIDRSVASTLRFTDYRLLLKSLRPDMFLVDDFDRTSLCSASQDTLYLFDMIHAEYKNMLMVLTANYPKKIEKALLRPGRIDCILDFALPTLDEREHIIKMHMKSDENLKEMAEITEGFSHADVAGFAALAHKIGYKKAQLKIHHLKTYRDQASEFLAMDAAAAYQGYMD